MEGSPLTVEDLRYGVERYLSIKSASGPSFAFDDSRIAYLTDVTGVPQVWSTRVDGKEEEPWPQQLTTGKERVAFASFAPDRDSLAFGADAGGDEHFQIQILEDGGSNLVKLTDNPAAIHSWGDWSPDGASVCYSSNERDRAFFDIYVKSTSGGEAERVLQHDGNNYPLRWSPDGSSLLFTRYHAPFNHDLYLLRLSDRTLTQLTPHAGDAVYEYPVFDQEGDAIYCITDEGREYPGLAKLGLEDHSLEYVHTESWELEGLAATRDAKTFAFVANEDGYSRLYTWSPGSGSPRMASIPNGVIGGMTWSNDPRRLAFALSSSTKNSDIWMYDPVGDSARRVTHSSTCGIGAETFSEERLFRFQSFDGTQVPAFLYRPREAGPTPLLVYLHGGPESQFRPNFSPLLQYVLSLGFAVLAPNFRGSTGYGRKYTHLDDVYNRMNTVKDSIAALEEAQKLIPVDPRRIVAMGGSYGGFMVLGCMYAFPDVWAAGIDIVGISNFVTFLKNTGPWRRKLRIAEYGDPDSDREFLQSISPTTNAHLIKAPLFIIHGANDPRVPVEEATQIMQTMEKLGRPAHLLVFRDEGHGLVKLNNRIEGYSEALGFVLSHLQMGAEP